VLIEFEREVVPAAIPERSARYGAEQDPADDRGPLGGEGEALGPRRVPPRGRKRHRRLGDIDHALGVLWDLRRRGLAGEYVRLDDDLLDRYVVSPGRDAPDGYRW